MIEFNKHPHIEELITHYANTLNKSDIVTLLSVGVQSKQDAYTLCKFVLKVIDQMAIDMQENKTVLGSTDNTTMIPDIDYEISLYLSNKGLEDIWDEVCNEE